MSQLELSQAALSARIRDHTQEARIILRGHRKDLMRGVLMILSIRREYGKTAVRYPSHGARMPPFEPSPCRHQHAEPTTRTAKQPAKRSQNTDRVKSTQRPLWTLVVITLCGRRYCCVSSSIRTFHSAISV